jgi:hypothetical protein
MMKATGPRHLLLAMLGAALGTSGCLPLPISHMEQVTPRVLGQVRTSNGTAGSAVQLALTAEDKDTTCMRPAVRTATDAAGAFQVSSIEERKSIFWLTLMENPGRVAAYWLCAHAADGGATAYQARTHIAGHLDGDTLDCVVWSWDERRRIACNTATQTRFLAGGTWGEGADTGTFRIILADEDSYGSVFRGYVQWIARPGGVQPDSLRAMAELPVGAQLAWVADAPTLLRDNSNGRWYLTGLSTRRTRSSKNRLLKFELGPPGEVREVAISPN